MQSKWISNLSSVSLLNSILLTVLELHDKIMLDLAAVMTVIPMNIFFCLNSVAHYDDELKIGSLIQGFLC